MVAVARTAAPQAQPVSASIPEGMSTARIGAPVAFISSTAAAGAPASARESPVPNSASTTTPPRSAAGGEGLELHTGGKHRGEHDRGVRAESALSTDPEGPHFVPRFPGPACHDESVAAVVAGPADHRNPANVRPAPDDRPERALARPFHEIGPGYSAFRNRQPLELAHLRGRAERLATADAGRRNVRWIRRRGAHGNVEAPGSIRECPPARDAYWPS